MKLLVTFTTLFFFFLSGCLNPELPTETAHCKIDTPQIKGVDGGCVANVAFEKRDVSICSRSLGNPDDCIADFAYRTNDSSICKQIKSTKKAIACTLILNPIPLDNSATSDQVRLSNCDTELTGLHIRFFVVSSFHNENDTTYASSVTFSNNAEKSVCPTGTAKLEIYDRTNKIFESTTQITNKNYSSFYDSLTYSANIPVTYYKLRELTNDSNVQVKFQFSYLDSTISDSTEIWIR